MPRIQTNDDGVCETSIATAPRRTDGELKSPPHRISALGASVSRSTHEEEYGYTVHVMIKDTPHED
jgi:hypothetical protein